VRRFVSYSRAGGPPRRARATYPDTLPLLHIVPHKVDEVVELDLALARLLLGLGAVDELLRCLELHTARARVRPLERQAAVGRGERQRADRRSGAPHHVCDVGEGGVLERLDAFAVHLLLVAKAVHHPLH